MVASSRGVVARNLPPERQAGKVAVQSTNNATRVWLILPDSLSKPTPIRPPKIILHQRPGGGTSLPLTARWQDSQRPMRLAC